MTTGPNRSKGSADGLDGGAFPRAFGNYILLMPFARGGMGEVYLAKHGAILGAEKYCVLKKLRPELTEDREYVARFIDEARVVVQLNHANICQVFDVGRVGTEYYLAMEYVSGRDVRSLQDRAKSAGVAATEAGVLHLLAETLSALDYAHRRTHPMTGEPLNLVHRDVSPQNIMVSFEGEVKLIDFGLASSRLKVERTQPNIVMGKMAYMAPEQARGDAIDKRADLFAAAVVGYELMAGERFYAGMSSQEIWYVVGRGGFVPSRWTELNPDVARILGKALAPDPDSRYTTCAELRDAVMAYLHTRHPGLGERTLREHVQRLYQEEIRRERDLLLGFAEVSGELPPDVLEQTRSQSVSLAHAGDLVAPQGAASVRVVHDEQTRGSAGLRSSSAPKTEIVEGPPETKSDDVGIPEEPTLLEQSQALTPLGVHDRTTRTPPTGITRSPRLSNDRTHLGPGPDDRTHLADDASSEQTAMVRRAPAPLPTMAVTLPAHDGTRRGRTPLLLAGAMVLVLLAGASLVLLGGQRGADATKAEGTVVSAPPPAPVVDAHAAVAPERREAEGAPANEERPAVAAAGAEVAPTVDTEPPAPTEASASDDQDLAAAARAPLDDLEDTKATRVEPRRRAKERTREASKRAEAEKKRAAAEAEAEAQAAHRRAAAAERKRAAQARAQEPPKPRETAEQMLRVLMTCGLPATCSSNYLGAGFPKYQSSTDETYRRGFVKHLRECRAQCAR